MMKLGSVKFALKNEEGSISILIIGLFLATLSLSFVVIDISGNFAAKQELIQTGERAISRAAHNLDQARYYSGNELSVGVDINGPIYRVPIDCVAAYASFIGELSSSLVKGQRVILTEWSCESDLLTATIETRVPLLLNIPFLTRSFASTGSTGSATSTPPQELQRIIATIKATSTIG